MEFEVGDLVYLDLEGINITPKGASRKLLPRRVGPFKILQKYSGLNYKVDIPQSWKHHPTFHVSRLEKAKVDDNPLRDKKPTPLVWEDGVVEHIVEDIVERRLLRGRRDKNKAENYKYKVHWKGYGVEQDTWEDYQEVLGLEAFDKYCEVNKLSSIRSTTGTLLSLSEGECNDRTSLQRTAMTNSSLSHCRQL